MNEIKRNPLNVATLDSNTLLNPLYERIAEVVLSEENIGDNLEIDYSGGYVQLVGNEGDVISEAYVGAGTGTAIVVATDDKLLSLEGENLSSNISLVYSDSEKKIKLIGKDGLTVISEVDSSDFVKDSFLKSASYDPSSKTLTFVFVDADGTESTVNIDMSSLADTYTAGNGVAIVSNEVSILINPDSSSLLSVSEVGLSANGVNTALAAKANVSDVYTKAESDAALAITQSEVDALELVVEGVETKLDTIAEGAEVNVQSDWSATEGDAMILNKPTIPTIDGLATTTYVDTQDALKANSADVYTKTESDAMVAATEAEVVRVEGLITTLDGIVATKVASVASSDNAIEVGGTVANPTVGLKIDTTATAGNVAIEITESGLKASANITQFQTLVVDELPSEGSSLYYYLVKTATDNLYQEYVWSEVSSGTFEFIYLGDTSVDLADYVTNDELTAALLLKADNSVVEALSSTVDGKVDIEEGKSLVSDSEITKLGTIAEGAQVNVQSDWDATEGDAMILNKPTIPSIDGLATEEYVNTELSTKQDTLISGTNIATLNGQSIVDPLVTAVTVGDVYFGDTIKTVEKIVYGDIVNP